MARKNKKSRLKNSGYAKYIVAALVLVILAAFAWHYHKSNGAKSTTSSAVSSPKSIRTQKASPSSKETVVSPSDKSPTVPGYSSAQLSSPDRVTYASNHSPASASDTEISTFATSPTAVCTITFSNGSITRKLPEQTASSNGTVTWYWKPSQVGLTSGNWKMTAVTSLNGQTKTSSDLNLLQVP